MVYTEEMSQSIHDTFEDSLWQNADQDLLRNAKNIKGRTILYGLWHSSRIEDITMNLLVANQSQIFEQDQWFNRIKSTIRHTGNSLTKEQIDDFSQKINIEELKNYRTAVGRNSRLIIDSLNNNDFKRKVLQHNLQRIINEEAVDNVETANWLINFWSKKDTAGIILMPCLRHQLMHINESIKAKNNYYKNKKEPSK